MARAGMARWRAKNPANGESDEVQRSLELLDRVLSEFDDLENGNVCGPQPEHQSPSLGHQSEDDGYMSMNGRRAKCSPEEELPELLPPEAMVECPPPPEEAERVISTLLPRVSPSGSATRTEEPAADRMPGAELLGHWVTTATQTTLPKTRHQRPYGWQTAVDWPPFHLQEPPLPEHRFASLPYDGVLRLSQLPAPWLPPRAVPSAVEVCRRDSDDSEGGGCGGEEPCPPLRMSDELADFSDDSLDGFLPPAIAKRNSIAWEVPLEADPLLTPGSTKVVGRRRRRSTDHSSCGSIHKVRDTEEWPDPPASIEDTASSFSDSYYDSSIANDAEENGFLPARLSSKQPSQGGTYIIRKGRKKERKSLPKAETPPHQRGQFFGELKRCSSTFDNIKSLLKDGLLAGLDEPPPDFLPPAPPSLVRVVSLPSLATSDLQLRDHQDFSSVPRVKDVHHRSKTDLHRLSRPHELAVTMEEEEDPPYCYGSEDCNGVDDQMSDLRVSEEERKLIAQLERDNSGQFLDTSAESLLLGDRDFLGFQKRSLSSEQRSNHSLSSRASSKDNTSKSNGFHCQEPYRISTDSLNLYRDVPRYSVSEKRQDFGRKTSERLTGSQEALLENVRQDTNFKKRPDCLRSRSEEYAKMVDVGDVWLMASELKNFHTVPVVEGEACRERSEEFAIAVDVLQCEFPPLPPSPVEEDEDEYSEILHPSPAETPRERDKADTLPEPLYRSLEPPSEPSGSRFLNRPCPPEPPPHFEPSSSLKTRSMDAGFSRGHSSQSSGSRREIPAERRTLPSELPGPPRRRTFQKRSTQSSQTETMQTCCSLPETPIFTRGCDIPRTPHRRAPDVPSTARTTPRPGGLASSSYRRVCTGPMGQALVGAELLRLAGGPGRGWYPRQRQTRPASIEHLDRLAMGHGPWETRDSRKPLTLPPNLSPKFFHRSPREALRRVTSLLIRKGGSSKEGKKDAPSPTASGEGAESSRHKRGFFKNLWKRSRHYSLEHQ